MLLGTCAGISLISLLFPAHQLMGWRDILMSSTESKSEHILDELKRRRAQDKIIEVEEGTVKVVIFSLLNELYAFKGPEVKEILPLVPIYYVPGSPDFIPGVINIRGDIESVIKINGFLGLEDSKPSAACRIAVTEKNGIRSGIILDSVEDVVDIPESSVKPPLSTLNKEVKGFVTGELIYRDRNVTILDVGMVFSRIGSRWGQGHPRVSHSGMPDEDRGTKFLPDEHE